MRKYIQVYAALIMSIIFIPAAYIYMAAGFVVQISRKDFSSFAYIKQNKNLMIISTCIVMGIIFSQYKIISLTYGLMILISVYSLTYTSIYMQNINIDKIIKIIYIVSAVVFILGIIQYLNPAFDIPAKWVDGEEYKLKKRVFSTFFNPNVFGFYINIIIIMICGSIDSEKPKKLDKIKITSLITGFICLFLTFSRTAWISLVVSLFIAGVLFEKKYFKYAATIALLIIGFDYILDTGRSNPSKMTGDSSIYYRLELWQACCQIFKDNPLIGIGFGTLSKYIPQYSSIISPNVEHCHNVYIQIAIETGIVGICGFLYIAFDTAKLLLHKFKTTETDERNMWRIISIIIIMTMLHSAFDSVVLTPQIMMILGILVGSVCGENKKRGFGNAKSL